MPQATSQYFEKKIVRGPPPPPKGRAPWLFPGLSGHGHDMNIVYLKLQLHKASLKKRSKHHTSLDL